MPSRLQGRRKRSTQPVLPRGKYDITKNDTNTNSTKKLQLLRTYKGITSVIRMILTRMSQIEEVDFEREEFKKEGKLSLDWTIVEQEKIGWKEFCQGYMGDCAK